MKDKIENLIKEALENLGIKESISFVIESPEENKNGDYATNVAMVYAKSLKENSKGLAEKIVKELRSKLENSKRFDLKNGIKEIQIAGPGFINFYLSHEYFINKIEDILEEKENWGKNDLLKGKKVMIEYTQPNPFKPFHIGHLMSNSIGESISRIFEFSGAKVIRANYQGDVGPHVAKAIYGLIKLGLPDENKSISEKAQYIGKCYVKGSSLYEEDKTAKKDIDEINKKLYKGSDSNLNEIYDWGREITLEAFEEIYKILGTKFDKYYFESKMAPKGEKIVKYNINKVFEKSDGAIIFPAEKYDPKLHTRVFVNSKGLPTYETKEIGLILNKFKKSILNKELDLSIVITAVEQAEYMKVVQKAISIMYPKLEKKMKHITHGMMRFAEGKMSSRKGNVITGESLLYDSTNIILEKMKEREFKKEEKGKIAKQVGVSALKYSILKSSLNSDIIYNFKKSVSFAGDSGPYLQYTIVRANSILKKAKKFNLKDKNVVLEDITELEKMINKFPDIVLKSYELLEPHNITTYLTKLASIFNTFYNSTQILKKDNQYINYHLKLIKAFSQTMQNGLWLLGIEVPKRM